MKRKFSKILVSTLAVFISTKSVFADTIKENYVYYNDQQTDGHYRIHKTINNEQTDLIKIRIAGSSTEQIGFCIDVGASLPSGSQIYQIDDSLATYLNKTLNDSLKSKKLADEINEIIHFGYETNKTDNYYAATQKMIWDKLYAAGYRTNFYGTDVTFSYGTTVVDFKDEISAINKAVADNKKTPSQCSSTTKLELAVGETATYTDKNGVLSNYKVKCSDSLKCEISGNDLKITVLKESGSQKITFSKDGSGTGTVVYKEGNNQAVVINTGSLAPVSCEFGIDTYKNSQTAGVKNLAIISIGLLFGLVAYAFYCRSQINTSK